MSATTPTRSRGRGRLRLLGLTGLLAAAAMVALPPLGVAAATPFGSNLVKNGGAESGLSGWDTAYNAQTHAYGKSGFGFPSKATATKIGGSAHFFYAGLYDTVQSNCGDFQQQWTLKGIGSLVDSGHVKVRLRGYAGTNAAADLNAHLDLNFRDSANHQVASNGITKTASGTNEAYVKFDVTKTLSKHTRILRIHLWADGDATITSGDCQAFWDNLSVVLIQS